MTRGQFGFLDDDARNELSYQTINFGGSYRRPKVFSLSADLTYMQAEEAIDPVTFMLPPELESVLIESTYDLSTIHTYSDLDYSSWNILLRGDVHVTERLLGTVSYGYYSFDDNAPYLEDFTGDLSIFWFGARWLI